MSRPRIEAIDTARGTAMLAVFLSHFSFVYFENDSVAHPFLPVLMHIAKVASPTFVIISGIMLGFLFETHREDFTRIRAKLITRGLFLLTIGRVLILSAHIAAAGGILSAFRWGFMTDTLGVSMILGSLLVDKIRPPARIVIGLTLVGCSTVVALLWFPDGTMTRIIKEILFGEIYEHAVLNEFFPLVPWVSLYFMSSVLGERIGRLYQRGEDTAVEHVLLRSAVAALLFVAIVRVLWFALQASRLVTVTPFLESLFAVMVKRPPMPLYFVAYGGIGLLLSYAVLRAARKFAFLRSPVSLIRICGQVSLFVFIVQYYVYFTGFALLRLPFSAWWPVYFLISVIVILGVSRFWYKSRLWNAATGLENRSSGLVLGVLTSPGR